MQLLTVHEVGKMIGQSYRTVWRKASVEPGFPKPVKLSKKCTRWVQSEIEIWIITKRAN